MNKNNSQVILDIRNTREWPAAVSRDTPLCKQPWPQSIKVRQGMSDRDTLHAPNSGSPLALRCLFFSFLFVLQEEEKIKSYHALNSLHDYDLSVPEEVHASHPKAAASLDRSCPLLQRLMSFKQGSLAEIPK